MDKEELDFIYELIYARSLSEVIDWDGEETLELNEATRWDGGEDG